MEEGAVPGLRYFSHWLDSASQRSLLLDIDVAAWSSELRRRVQHYGHRYDYGRRTVKAAGRSALPAPPLPEWAEALAARIFREGHMSQVADQVIVNEYWPGQGISAHVDCVPCFGPEIATVSLGSACVMDFTGPDDHTRVSVWLEPGSLGLMTGPARYSWRHAIAARKTDPAPHRRVKRSRRVSVTFRTVLS